MTSMIRASDQLAPQELVLQLLRRCIAGVLKGSPPQPSEDVTEFLRSLHITKRHLQAIYQLFHGLRELEVNGEEIVQNAIEIDRETLKHLIPTRRKWVYKLLIKLLDLGQCTDQITWDKFLYILINFCSLNRVELAQTLFLIIVKETGKNVQHYVTALDLQQFFWFWRECNFKSFNTRAIDFDLLPLTRYYVSDFTELISRYTVLLNPLLHLQQTLMEQLPSWEFWDNVDRTNAFCRKIHMDFFVLEEDRVHLYGEPPFRETCDMLVPDALGAVPINKRQWIMRTAGLNYGYGLRQASVWGEQIPPETIEVQEAEYEKYKKQQERERKLAGLPEASSKPGAPGTTGPAHGVASPKGQKALEDGKAATTGAWPAGGGAPELGAMSPTRKAKEEKEKKEKDKNSVPADPRQDDGPVWKPDEPPPNVASAAPSLAHGLDAQVLSIRAAASDEKDERPTPLLPPVWMKACTIAPPPKNFHDDRPLPGFSFGGTPLDPRPESPRREGREAASSTRGLNSTMGMSSTNMASTMRSSP